MAVAPDLLLQMNVEVKPRYAPAKTAEKPAQPGRDDFSNVYARERQNQAPERREAASRSATGEVRGATERAGDGKPAQHDGDTLAADGKGLPSDAPPGGDLPAVVDDQSALAELDPLLLLGLTGQEGEQSAAADLPQAAAQSELSDQAEEDSADLLLDAVVLGAQPASVLQDQISKPSTEAELQVNGTLNVAQRQAALASSSGAPAQAASELLEENAGSDPHVEQWLPENVESLSRQLEQPLSNASLPRAEPLEARLSVLSQAIAQNNLNTARVASPVLPQVPGAALNLQQPGWAEGAVDKVMWMSSQNLKSAEIELNPAELGRLEVRISLNQEQTQITFASANANVRDALETQLHRLREMFNQQGMTQLDVNVSDQSPGRGWQGQGEEGRGATAGRKDREADPLLLQGVSEVHSQPGRIGLGLVDYYA